MCTVLKAQVKTYEHGLKNNVNTKKVFTKLYFPLKNVQG